MELLRAFSLDWTLTDTIISLVALGMDLGFTIWLHPLSATLGKSFLRVKWNNASECLAQIAPANTSFHHCYLHHYFIQPAYWASKVETESTS